MEKYYHDNRGRIYNLIKSGDDESLYKEFPKIKIYRRFIDLIIDICQDEFPYLNEPYFVSKILDEVLALCEKIYVSTNDMINDRELVKSLFLAMDREFGSDELLVVFNPDAFYKHSDDGAYYLRFLCRNLDLLDGININGEKYKVLVEKLKLIDEKYSKMYSDTSLFIILFYCYMNNNYEYLDNYLSNVSYYHDKLIMSGIVEEPDYAIFSGDAKKIFRKVETMFCEVNKEIK